MPLTRVLPLRTLAVGVVACGICLAVPLSSAQAAPTLPALQGIASASFVGADYSTTVQDANGDNTPFLLKSTAALTASALDLTAAEQSKSAADSLDATSGSDAPILGPTATSTAPPGGTANVGPTAYDVPFPGSDASAASVSGVSQTATTRTVTDASTETGAMPVASAGTSGGTYDIAPAGTIDPADPAAVAIRQATAKVAAADGTASPSAVDPGTGQFSATGGSTATSLTIGGGGTTLTSSASATSGDITVVRGLLAIQVGGPATLSATAQPDPNASTATYTAPTLSYDLGGTGTFTPVPAGGLTLDPQQQADFGLNLTITPGAIQKTVTGQTIAAAAVAATVTLSVGDPAAPLFSVTAQVGQLAVSAAVPAAAVVAPTPTPTAPATGSQPILAETGASHTAPLTWLGIALTVVGAGTAYAARRRTRAQH